MPSFTASVEGGPSVGWRSNHQGDEAEGEDRVFEGGAEELPKRSLRAGIVRREEEKGHHGQTAEGGPSDQNARDEAYGYE